MAHDYQYIQQLISAEQVASRKIDDARNRKNRKLKQAKDEAVDEINRYKLERENKYRQVEDRFAGDKDGLESRVDKETTGRLSEMYRQVKNQKDKVIVDLLNVTGGHIEPQLHINVRSDYFAEQEKKADEARYDFQKNSLRY